MKFALVAALAIFSATRPSSVVSQGPTHNRSVTLTFDAGADRGYAASILKTLERTHVHVTFGMTGKWALANPDLVHRMAADSDTFINHTFDHRSFTGLSTHTNSLSLAQRTWEITQTERIVHRMTGLSTRPYFRPPFGDTDPATLLLARRLGYTYTVMWTIDSLGWTGLSAQAIIDRCTRNPLPGEIFLMHVGSQSQDAVALPRLIQSLQHAGFRFVTLQHLLRDH